MSRQVEVKVGMLALLGQSTSEEESERSSFGFALGCSLHDKQSSAKGKVQTRVAWRARHVGCMQKQLSEALKI